MATAFEFCSSLNARRLDAGRLARATCTVNSTEFIQAGKWFGRNVSQLQYIVSKESDPVQRIKALHDYVADRIAYDAESYFAGQYPPQDAETVFRTRKSVCAGYAKLLEALGKAAGEEIIYVVGDARTQTSDLSGQGHAWNAAKVKGQWYLIDATWDSGYVDRSSGFTKNYRTEYLMPPPEVMVISHFPKDPAWQLLSNPLPLGEFLR